MNRFEKPHWRRCVAALGSALLLGLATVACERSAPAPDAPNATTETAAASVINAPDPASLTEEQARAKTIEIATKVRDACGGQEAWENLRYITFEYFMGRRFTWDKQRNIVRLDMPSSVDAPKGVILDLDADRSQAWDAGVAVTNPARAMMVHTGGTKFWDNDSMWLFGHMQLLDDGVELKYLGPGTTEDGREAVLLDALVTGYEHTNRVIYYIDPHTHRVLQWDYFNRVRDTEPQISCAWNGWTEFNGVLLSLDRGTIMEYSAQFTDVVVYDELPEAVFQSIDPVPQFLRDFMTGSGTGNAAGNGSGGAE